LLKGRLHTGYLQFLGFGIPENRQKAITAVKNSPTYRGSSVFTAFRLAYATTIIWLKLVFIIFQFLLPFFAKQHIKIIEISQN
jgi:hypothetical protein